MVSEIDRVAQQTTFNGTKLLNGGSTGAVFQIGANAGDSITIDSISNTTAAKLGIEDLRHNCYCNAYRPRLVLESAIAAGTITISGNGVEADLGRDRRCCSVRKEPVKSWRRVNDKTGQTGVFAYITSGNKMKLQSQTGSFVSRGCDLTAAQYQAQARTRKHNHTGVANLSVATYGASQTAIALVDDALSKINTSRSTLGAIQSRFESAVSSQQTTSENLSASRARIQDADFAAETANLAKAQILQQSGIAMLAQANAIPQNVLALLQ